MAKDKLVSMITVDNVIFGYTQGQLWVLLVQHGQGKSRGEWGLPGDWLRADESMEQAACRILFNRTGLDNVHLTQLHTFSAVDRYPAKRIVTTAYFTLMKKEGHEIKASADELDAAWFEIDKVPKLIFDHQNILATGLEELQKKTCHEPIGLELLDKKFTFLELQELYEAILARNFDKPNFRRKFLKLDYLVDCGEQVKIGKHRSAGLYRFDLSAYKALTRQGFSFSL